MKKTDEGINQHDHKPEHHDYHDNSHHHEHHHGHGETNGTCESHESCASLVPIFNHLEKEQMDEIMTVTHSIIFKRG